MLKLTEPGSTDVPSSTWRDFHIILTSRHRPFSAVTLIWTDLRRLRFFTFGFLRCPNGVHLELNLGFFDRFFVQRLIAIVCRRPLNFPSISLPTSPGEICPILMISSEDSFLYSTKLLLSFLVKISTRYPYFGDSAETGKRCSILGCLCPKVNTVDSAKGIPNPGISRNQTVL